MTIAADVVIQQVAEPVRFVVETKARIYPSNERYWYYQRRSLIKQYQVRFQYFFLFYRISKIHVVLCLQVRLKRSESPQGDKIFDVCGIDVSEELEDRTKLSLTMQLANLTASTLEQLFPYCLKLSRFPFPLSNPHLNHKYRGKKLYHQ